MKIACATIMKNEADVLPHWLRHVQSWADVLLFLDNGSTDGSFEIAKRAYSASTKLVWMDRDVSPFRISLRDRMTEPARAAGCDWIYFCDPDERPFFDLRRTIQLADHAGCTSVYVHYPVFFLTRQEFWRYECENAYYRATHERDPFLTRHWYRETGAYSSKIYKLTPDFQCLQEPAVTNGPAYKENLHIGHYRFRNPKQIEERLRIRRAVRRGGNVESFQNYTGSWNWMDYLIDERLLHRRKEDARGGGFVNEGQGIIPLWELVKQNRELPGS